MKIVERYPLWLRIARGGGAARALHPARFVLARLYGLGLVCTGASNRGTLPPPTRTEHGTTAAGQATRLPIIVSIGNLEAGGGGKTPLAIALAEAIRVRGGLAVVVTRGYRGALEGSKPNIIGEIKGSLPKGARLVQTDKGASASAERRMAEIARLAGDEVALYAARGIPVVVDANRARGARVAAEAFEPTHILLDDAFRHREPAKDLDILLLDAEKPFGTGELIPLGTLREPPSAARRAGAIVFTRASGETAPAAAAPFVEGKPVFFARHEATALVTRGGERPLGELGGSEAVLFSGIARPEPFEQSALSLGAKVATSFRYEDHHMYRPRDIEEIVSAGAPDSLFLTTEKDYVKAAALFPPDADLRALRIEMRLQQFDSLLALIGA